VTIGFQNSRIPHLVNFLEDPLFDVTVGKGCRRTVFRAQPIKALFQKPFRKCTMKISFASSCGKSLKVATYLGIIRVRRGRGRMVVEFITTNAINATI